MQVQWLVTFETFKLGKQGMIQTAAEKCKHIMKDDLIVRKLHTHHQHSIKPIRKKMVQYIKSHPSKNS
jgi:hypothetical protein